jgi:methyl-accepting chemotaxis protein
VCGIFAIAATGTSAQNRPFVSASQTSAATLDLKKLPPEDARRVANLRHSLQPSARAWVEQEAASQKGPAPDLAAIGAAVRQRFASMAGKSLSDLDVDALVAAVMAQAADSQQQDLSEIMQQTQAINRQKDQLRNLLDQINRAMASLSAQKPKEPCRTPACVALPGQLAQVAASAAQTKVRVNTSLPANPTHQQLNDALSQLQGSADSLSDVSSETQLRLQMATDRYSKFMEALSDIMKSISDTQTSIVSNMK